MEPVLTKAKVSEYIRYEPDTGNFYWIKDTNSRGPSKIGQLIGGVNSLGYWQIGLFGYRLLGHRLAWLLTYGCMPKFIDHRNGKPWDNRLENLREATQAQNLANVDYGPLRGIELHGRKYRVRFFWNRNRIEVGSYATLEEAKEAYTAAANKYQGEFAFANR